MQSSYLAGLGKTALFALVSFPTWVSGANLLHYYDFEENSNDLVGSANGINGAEVAISEGFDGGKSVTFNSGLTSGEAFDNTGYVGLNPAIQDVSGAFSFSYWVKLQVDETTNPRGIFDFSGDGDDGPQSLFIQTGANENKMAFRVDGQGSGAVVSFVDVPEDDTWFFVAATFQPDGELKVYVNGVLKDTMDATGVNNVFWNNDQYFGAFNVNTNTNRGLAGSLDDFAIYSGILTDSQIANLFDSTILPTDIRELPEAPALIVRSLSHQGDSATITFTSGLERKYRIFGGADLANPDSWVEVSTGLIDGTGEEISFNFDIEDNTPIQFYQVREEPN